MFHIIHKERISGEKCYLCFKNQVRKIKADINKNNFQNARFIVEEKKNMLGLHLAA